MLRTMKRLAQLAGVLGGLSVCAAAGVAADLPKAGSEDLVRIYGQLRALQLSDRAATTENVAWKRDAATFNFQQGRIVFAAPVEGRVLGAVFEGRGTFTLSPPTPVDQRQIARYTKEPRLEDQFKQAVFFFTDDSASELEKLVKLQGGGNVLPGGALAEAQKQYAENYNDWWGNEAKGYPQMRNLAARMLSDLTDPTSRGFFLADFKGDRYGDLLLSISWNRDSTLSPGFNNDEEVMLLHVNRGNYTEWWSGFHLTDEYTRTPHPEHRQLIAHCRKEVIDAEIGKDKNVSATAEMEFEVPAAPARVLPLLLRGVLRISDVTDADGKKLAFIQEDRKLDNDPWVILPEPAKSGQVYKMKITYTEDSTRDSRIVYQRGPGLYYVTARESWFPSFGAFDDRTQYVMHVRSPKRFKFVGTGHMTKSEKGKDYLATDWESEIPYSVVGFNYGDFVESTETAANLTVTAYSGKEIPDELRGLQTAIDTAELAGGSGGSRNIAGEMGIATGGFNTAANVKFAAAISSNAMKLFTYYFGPLPFKSVSVTEQPVRGYGQSWPTLIFLPYDVLLDSTTRQGLRLQDSAEAREFYNIVAVHEMAHQWWGHLVGWKTYRDVWLSEGFAEFSAYLYLRKSEPNKVRSFWDLKRRHLLEKNSAGHRPVEVGPLTLAFQLSSYMEPGNYQSLVYFKGAYVLEMLRVMMENPQDRDPDLRFINMMREFAAAYSAKNASTEDFRKVVEKHMGRPMDWFFNQWVYGTEVPHYDFSYQLKDAGGKTTLQVALKQSGVSDSFQMALPLQVYVGGQPRRLGMMQVKGSNTSTGEVQLPFRPEKVVIDDDHSILCTVNQ